MDNHELLCKRQRVSVPSQLSLHQNLSLDQSNQSGPRSFLDAGLALHLNTHPTPGTEANSPASLAMACGVSAQLHALKDFLHSTLSSTTSKGKSREVVDLTIESDSSERSASPIVDDEDLARRLQAQYDAEDSNQQPSSHSSDDLVLHSDPRATEIIEDDERLARKLQAELDQEESGPEDVPVSISPKTSCKADYQRSLSAADEQDEAYARQLQAEFDEEHMQAIAPSARAFSSAPAAQEQQPASTPNPQVSRRSLQTFAEAIRHT